MKKLMRYLALSLMFCLILLPATKVKAADSGVWVTGYSNNEISVQWNQTNHDQAISNFKTYLTNQKLYNSAGTLSVKYVIGIGGDENTASNNCSTDVTDRNNFTFSDLTGGAKYYVTVKYYVYQPAFTDATTKKLVAAQSSSPQLIGTCSQTTRPNAPTNVRSTFWTLGSDKLVVEWDHDGNASGYVVQYKDSDADLHSKTVTEKKITLNTEYTKYFKVSVKAFVTDGNNKIYSDLSDEFYSFAQPQINETEDGYDITIKSGKMKISWEKISNASGYEIYVGTKKNGPYKKVKTIKNKGTTKATFKYSGKKFNKNKEYFVYVVSYRTKGGKTTKSSANQVYNYRKGDTFATIRKTF